MPHHVFFRKSDCVFNRRRPFLKRFNERMEVVRLCGPLEMQIECGSGLIAPKTTSRYTTQLRCIIDARARLVQSDGTEEVVLGSVAAIYWFYYHESCYTIHFMCSGTNQLRTDCALRVDHEIAKCCDGSVWELLSRK